MPAHTTLSRSQLSSLLNRTGKQSAVICGIFVMLATRGAQAAPTVSFNTPRVYPAGSVSVAVGDFNGDGTPDLAVVGLYGNSPEVSVLLGNGDGSFQPPVAYALLEPAYSVALGDFNHDGHIDLVVAGVKGVSVLLGNGDGTFRNPVQYSTGTGAYLSTSVAVGDFNGDGKADLAVTSGIHNTVAILAGKGDGTFGPPVQFPVGNNPVFVAVGDFNGDGKPDLAVANAGTSSSSIGSVSILIGNGSGGFEPAVNYGSASFRAIAVADFNGDGKPDLAVANDHYDAVTIMIGNGDGTFQPQVNYAAGAGPKSLAVGDFNGDGKLDLAVSSGVVLLGNGDGSFQPPLRFTTTVFQCVAVGDFNGDGKLDLAAGYSPLLYVMLGSGHATFQRPVSYAASGHPASVAVGDFNGDGKLDLAVANQSTVSILMGNGDGSFQPPVNYPAGTVPWVVAVGDFNGDGKLDLAVVDNGQQYTPSTVSILLGNGDGTFQPPLSFAVQVGPRSIVVADFNGDGKLDLAVANGGFPSASVSILLGNGDGTFQPAVNFQLMGQPYWMATGDFNGDGTPDLAVGAFAGTTILLGNGDGTFQPGATYPGVGGPMAVGDLNRDGNLDLVVYGNSYFSILFGNGDGTFGPPVNIPAVLGGSFVAVGDFNRDGNLDVVLVDYSSNAVSIVLGNGDGTFQPEMNFEVGLEPWSVAIGDFNGDGRPDLAVANSFSGTISILKNTTRP